MVEGDADLGVAWRWYGVMLLAECISPRWWCSKVYIGDEGCEEYTMVGLGVMMMTLVWWWWRWCGVMMDYDYHVGERKRSGLVMGWMMVMLMCDDDGGWRSCVGWVDEEMVIVMMMLGKWIEWVGDNDVVCILYWGRRDVRRASHGLSFYCIWCMILWWER